MDVINIVTVDDNGVSVRTFLQSDDEIHGSGMPDALEAFKEEMLMDDVDVKEDDIDLCFDNGRYNGVHRSVFVAYSTIENIQG